MLEKLLRSKAEVRILGIALFNHGLHLREISRKAGVSSFETKKELDNLIELGILNKERRGNQLIFFPNEKCSFFSELKGLYMKTEGVNFSSDKTSKIVKKIFIEPELRPEYIKKIKRRMKGKFIRVKDFAEKYGLKKKSK